MGFLYPDFNALTRADPFQMFFTYRPSGRKSIWVPVGVYSWRWGGTATRNTTTNVWTLTSSHQSTPGFGQVTATYPVWSQMEYRDPACPQPPLE